MKPSIALQVTAATILSVLFVSSALSQQCCVVPQHETTTATGSSYQGTYFQQHVYNDSSYNFDGRHVREGNGSGSFDGCYFTNSIYPPWDYISTGDWVVGAAAVGSQNWGPDYLAWPGVRITYYREQRPARGLPMPCNTRIIQTLEMSCGSSWDYYTGNNVLTLWIDMTTVTNCRSDISNSQCLTQNYL